MRAGEPEIVAQEIDQRLARLDPFTDFLAVNAQPDLENAFAHGEAAKRELSRLNSIGIAPTPRQGGPLNRSSRRYRARYRWRGATASSRLRACETQHGR